MEIQNFNTFLYFVNAVLFLRLFWKIRLIRNGAGLKFIRTALGSLAISNLLYFELQTFQTTGLLTITEILIMTIVPQLFLTFIALYFEYLIRRQQ